MLPLPVAIVGCGQISQTYLKNLTTMYADRVKVIAVADVVAECAAKTAEAFKIERVLTTEQVLADKSVAMVLNLTPATAHYELNKQALLSGKHVYSEKPLALKLEHAHELANLAYQKGLRLSVAPDTVLGDSIQAVKKALADGKIGRPVAVTGVLSLSLTTERYATAFRGPILDLGPYHVGALLEWFGPARSVVAITHPFPQAEPGQPQLSDAALTLDTPVAGGSVIEFENGVIATLSHSAQISRYEATTMIYGSTGIINAGDPNFFSTKVTLDADGKTETLTEFVNENFRGKGVWDMAQAIHDQRPQHCGPDLALHATEILLSIVESSKTGRRINLTTRFTRRG